MFKKLVCQWVKELTILQLVKKYPKILWTTEVHYRIHSTLPLFRVLSQSNTVHTFAWYILIAFSHLCLGLPGGSFFRVSLQKRRVRFYPPMHVPQALPILSSLIEPRILGEGLRLVKVLSIHFSFIFCCFPFNQCIEISSRYPRTV